MQEVSIMSFENAGNALVVRHNGELLRIEPWGKDALRVRSTMLGALNDNQWALTEKPAKANAKIDFYEETINEGYGPAKVPVAAITNGHIRATVNHAGVISFYRDEALILREYYRSYGGTISRESRCLKTVNREWKGVIGGTGFHLDVKFESNDGEKIFGMG